MSVAHTPPPQCDSHKCLQTLSNVLPGQNLPVKNDCTKDFELYAGLEAPKERWHVKYALILDYFGLEK